MLAVEAQGVIALTLTTSALGRGTHAENFEPVRKHRL
jgi:hypothetical protein